MKVQERSQRVVISGTCDPVTSQDSIYHMTHGLCSAFPSTSLTVEERTPQVRKQEAMFSCTVWGNKGKCECCQALRRANGCWVTWTLSQGGHAVFKKTQELYSTSLTVPGQALGLLRVFCALLSDKWCLCFLLLKANTAATSSLGLAPYFQISLVSVCCC